MTENDNIDKENKKPFNFIDLLHSKVMLGNTNINYKSDLIKEREKNSVLQNQITLILKEKEDLEGKVECKNRELSAVSLFMSEKNRHIQEIVEYLSTIPKITKDSKLKEHLSYLKSNIRAHKDWKNFVSHFEKVNQGLIKRLKEKHTALTANDIRFIAYVYMNLSVKEIATVLNISLVACKKRKERICDKLELPKQTDLFDYILLFE